MHYHDLDESGIVLNKQNKSASFLQKLLKRVLDSHHVKQRPKVALFLKLTTALNQVTAVTIIHGRELGTGDRLTLYIIWSLALLIFYITESQILFDIQTPHKAQLKCKDPSSLA